VFVFSRPRQVALAIRLACNPSDRQARLTAPADEVLS
jgi:hypothetical protein